MVRKIRNVGVLERSSCPQDLVAHIAAEKVKWKRVIERAGLTP